MYSLFCARNEHSEKKNHKINNQKKKKKKTTYKWGKSNKIESNGHEQTREEK